MHHAVPTGRIMVKVTETQCDSRETLSDGHNVQVNPVQCGAGHPDRDTGQPGLSGAASSSHQPITPTSHDHQPLTPTGHQPLTPTGHQPPAPTSHDHQPLTPTGHQPLTPTGHQPPAPTSHDHQPLTPTGHQTLTPTSHQPLTPTGHQPPVSTSHQPITPSSHDHQPLTPTGHQTPVPTSPQPLTPTGHQPLTPTGHQPLVPTSHDHEPPVSTSPQPITPTGHQPPDPTSHQTLVPAVTGHQPLSASTAAVSGLSKAPPTSPGNQPLSASLPVRVVAKVPPPGGAVAKVPPPGGVVAKVPPPGGAVAKVPPPGGAVVKVPPPGGAVAKVPPPGGAVAKVPPPGGAVAKVLPAGGVVAKVPPPGGAVAKVLPAGGVVAKVLPAGGVVAKVPPPGGVVAKVPPPGAVVAKVPPPGGVVAKVPPPGGAVAKVPPPGGAVAKVPPPGGAVAKVPPPGGVVAKVPPPGGAVAKVPPPGGVVAKGPPPGGVVAKVLPAGGAVAKVPPPGGAVAKVPPPGGAVAKVPPPGVVVAKVPPPGGAVAKVPPPGGVVAKVPPPGGAVAKVPPPGGVVAKVPPPGVVVAKVPPPGGVVAKVPPPGGVVAKVHPQVKLPASIKQAATPGRTVVITVPRASGPPQPVAPQPRPGPPQPRPGPPQPVAPQPRPGPPQPVAPQPRPGPPQPRPGPPQPPANIQIPAGMMLIRSDSGQLIFVSQQALSQTQTPRVLVPQVSAAAGSKSSEKVTLIRMAAPAQKTAVVKVINVTKPAVVQTVSATPERGNNQTHVRTVVTATKEPPPAVTQATLDSVKKCKNFLVTLIKLASSDSRSASMANNVRGLVAALLEGKLEAEEFTERLYQELNSTPQPCLVPFLKKSLPAVRRLTPDPNIFIQQASTSSLGKGSGSVSAQQVNQQPRGLVTSVQTRAVPKHTVTPGKHLAGSVSVKSSFIRDSPHSTKFTFSSTSYKEDDDINDVASMAGVNLREENAQILTSVVGSVVQSCQDQLFLSAPPLLARILHTGLSVGVRDVGPDVVALLSHATQECLRGVLEKLSVMAGHRRAALKDDPRHSTVSDVRSQLRFLEEVETVRSRRREEEERERLLLLARSRSHTDDPLQQQLKQRAKEFQLLEAAEQQQREANITALAAIGPRRKRPAEQTENTVSVLSRQGVHRVTRVMLRDLLLYMEQDHSLHHSLTLYRALL